MKIKQKVIACSLLLAFSGTLGVAAKTEITDIEYNGNTITVTAVADGAKGTAVSFSVQKQGTSDLAGTLAVLERSLDDQKTAVFTVTLPDDKGGATDGTYTVSVKAAQEDADSETLVFVTSGKRQEKLQEITGKTTADDLETFLGVAENYQALKVMGVRVQMYDALCSLQTSAGKDEFLTALCGKLSGCADEKELKTTANQELERVTANYGSADDMQTVLLAMNPTYLQTAYRNITDTALKAWIQEQMYVGRPYSDFTALETRYQLVNIWYDFNHARSSAIANLLHTNAALLELTGTEAYQNYQSLSSDKQNQVAVEFVKLVAVTPISGNSDVKSYLEKAISNAGDPGSGTGNVTVNGIQSNTTMSGSGGSTGGVYVSPEKDDTPQATKKFQDLENFAWAEEAINALADKGILNGVGDGRFDPDRTITREEFAKVLALAWEYEIAEADTAFTDVDSGAWYAPYVASLSKAGIINGIGDGVFGVGSSLSRQDLAVLLSRVAGAGLTAVRQWQEFADDSAVSDYAKEAVRTLYCAGCIDGTDNGTFQPAAACTRAEAAKMIYRILGQ